MQMSFACQLSGFQTDLVLINGNILILHDHKNELLDMENTLVVFQLCLEILCSDEEYQVRRGAGEPQEDNAHWPLIELCGSATRHDLFFWDFVTRRLQSLCRNKMIVEYIYLCVIQICIVFISFKKQVLIHH